MIDKLLICIMYIAFATIVVVVWLAMAGALGLGVILLILCAVVEATASLVRPQASPRAREGEDRDDSDNL